MILNEKTRAEMTQQHSLEPQVHRTNKGRIEAFLWVFLPGFFFFFKDMLKQRLQHVKRKTACKNKEDIF